MKSSNKLCLLSLSFLLASCGGASDGSSDAGIVLVKAENVIATSNDGQVSISWNSLPSLSYDIYVATEGGLRFDSYASYDNSEWVKDVSTPYTFTPSDYSKKYFFTVVAKLDGKESEQSELVNSVPRYKAMGDVVEDLYTSLVWARCSVGQEWDESAQNCEGQPLRMSHQVASNTALKLGDGWRLPSKDELVSLVYCSNGIPDYFLSSFDEMCDAQEVMSPTIYQSTFPNVGIDSFYLTNSEKVVSSYPSLTFYYDVSFNDGGGSGIFGSEPTAKYARLVKAK